MQDYPNMTPEQQDEIVSILNEFVSDCEAAFPFISSCDEYDKEMIAEFWYDIEITYKKAKKFLSKTKLLIT